MKYEVEVSSKMHGYIAVDAANTQEARRTALLVLETGDMAHMKLRKDNEVGSIKEAGLRALPGYVSLEAMTERIRTRTPNSLRWRDCASVMRQAVNGCAHYDTDPGLMASVILKVHHREMSPVDKAVFIQRMHAWQDDDDGWRNAFGSNTVMQHKRVEFSVHQYGLMIPKPHPENLFFVEPASNEPVCIFHADAEETVRTAALAAYIMVIQGWFDPDFLEEPEFLDKIAKEDEDD